MISVALLIVVCTMYLSGAMTVGPAGAFVLWLLLCIFMVDLVESESGD